MVIKGSARGGSPPDVRRLADHLLSSENETVELVEITGSARPTFAKLLPIFGRCRSAAAPDKPCITPA